MQALICAAIPVTGLAVYSEAASSGAWQTPSWKVSRMRLGSQAVEAAGGAAGAAEEQQQDEEDEEDEL